MANLKEMIEETEQTIKEQKKCVGVLENFKSLLTEIETKKEEVEQTSETPEPKKEEIKEPKEVKETEEKTPKPKEEEPEKKEGEKKVTEQKPEEKAN